MSTRRVEMTAPSDDELRRELRKLSVHMAGAATFVGLGIWMMVIERPHGRGAAGFFGLCLYVFAAQAHVLYRARRGLRTPLVPTVPRTRLHASWRRPLACAVAAFLCGLFMVSGEGGDIFFGVVFVLGSVSVVILLAVRGKETLTFTEEGLRRSKGAESHTLPWQHIAAVALVSRTTNLWVVVRLDETRSFKASSSARRDEVRKAHEKTLVGMGGQEAIHAGRFGVDPVTLWRAIAAHAEAAQPNDPASPTKAKT